MNDDGAVRLIQEDLPRDKHYAWRTLVANVCLNRASGQVARRVLGEFFHRWPSPVRAAHADGRSMRAVLAPLGFTSTRWRRVRELSRRWASGDWSDVRELPGVGEYAAHSYAIFVEGRVPSGVRDARLLEYIHRTDGGRDV